MKIKLIIISAFILIYGTFIYINTVKKDIRINSTLNNQIKNLQTHYDITMDYFLQDVSSIRENIIINKKIIDICSKTQNANKEQKAILRERLYKLLLPMYIRVKKRGILQIHFVSKNNISFLRMHKPSKFGDDLTDVRYSYKYTNKTKKDIVGFEQGKTIHGFRYVYPLVDDKGNHLGAIETSLSSDALQEKLISVNKIHSHFLVNKNTFDIKAWKTKAISAKYIQSIEHKDYMFALTKHSNLNQLKKADKNIISKLQKDINIGISSKKPFALYINHKDTAKVITFLPISNTQNKIEAYIVSYTDNKSIYIINKNNTKLNILIFFIMLILSYFIYKNINRKEELEIKVTEKTKELKVLNDNLDLKVKEEISKNDTIKEQLYKSEKLASMGEMIGNIAHQWRQPLSVISTASTGMKMQKEFGTLSDEQFNKNCDFINDNAQYLSKTIDDFRNFIKGNREKSIFSLEEDINSFLHLVEGSVKRHNINIILDLKKDIKIDGYENELIQCYMNIFNNAKDALKENNVQDNRFIFISTSTNENNVTITIKDNAGGIPKDIINKIFEPYFTTKHKAKGTGLGLHMTYNLIVDGMNGTIEAINEQYIYNEKDYTGAKFTIILPIPKKKEII